MKFFKAIPLAFALYTATTSALPVARSTNYARDAPSDALEARTRFNILPFQPQRPPPTFFPRPAIFAPGRPLGRPIFRPAVQPSRRSELDDLAAIFDELAAEEPGSIKAREIQARFIDKIFQAIRGLFGRDLQGSSIEAREIQARFIDKIFQAIRGLFGRDLQDDELSALLEGLAAAEPGSIEARDIQARFIDKIFQAIRGLFGRDLQGGSIEARDIQARFIDKIFQAIRGLFGRDLQGDALSALLEDLATAEPDSIEARDIQARFIDKIFQAIRGLFGRDSGAADISARDLEARFLFFPALGKLLGIF